MYENILEEARELIDEIKQRLDLTLKEIEEITTKLEEYHRELNELSPLRGTIEYKWVRNKVGKKYWYYYLRVYDGGKLRSIYLGPRIPQEIVKRARDRVEFRELDYKIRNLSQRLDKLMTSLSEARFLL